jgi:hypothetical protein
MKKIINRGNIYNVTENEFGQSNKYDPIILYEKMAEFDKEIFLLESIAKINNNLNFANYGTSHDNYVFRNVEKYFNKSIVIDNLIISNLSPRKLVLRIEPNSKNSTLEYQPLMLLVDNSGNIDGYHKYLVQDNRYLYVRKTCSFEYELALRINKDNIIMLDNLLHITFMIKNSGEIIKDVLLENLKIADKITILDTGSTDNTLSFVKEIILQEKDRVRLYEEPFIDFSTSRNRLMDLAEEHSVCVFHMMLDDTYIIRNGDTLRSFLHEIRSDNFPTFSLHIKGTDLIYTSNRIMRPESKIRYKYKIHEILDTKEGESALIPIEKGFIEDLQSDYMITRTNDRKFRDLELLLEELKEKPTDSRIYYYLGETYLCLKDYENARLYYVERAQMDGFTEETYDALYKIAVIDHLHLNKNWSITQKEYLDCFIFNPTRSESLFMIGYEYYNKKIPELAHLFFKKAFEIGLPQNQNMNIKIEQACYILPSCLIQTCYLYKDFILGIKACNMILEYKQDDAMAKYWLEIFTMLDIADKSPNCAKKYPIKRKNILFLSDGGWEPWDGETLDKKGIGGSETFTIKYAEWLQKYNKYNVTVCCNCKESKVYNNVKYIPISECISYIKENHIDYAIVNRFPNYIYLLQHLEIKNIYLILHDIVTPGQIIPILPYLKQIFCISNWAKRQFLDVFNSIPSSLCSTISYGIDTSKFPNYSIKKYSFIYSSFANRGLLELLKMFPRIVDRYPEAHLNVFCDLENKWLLEHHSEQVEEIQILLEKHKDCVINYGWVNQKILNIFWSTSHVWLYPCTFAETCCLTAYEAAASKTLAISNDLAALRESVGYEKAIIVEGDATTEEWKDKVLDKLFNVLDNGEESKYVDKNFHWVSENKNFETTVKEFADKFLI